MKLPARTNCASEHLLCEQQIYEQIRDKIEAVCVCVCHKQYVWCWSVPGIMLREIKTKTQRLFQHNLLYSTETRQIFSNHSFKAGISVSVIIVILEPETIQPVCSQRPAFVLMWKSKSSFRYLEAYRWKPACTTRVKETQKERGYRM